MPTLPSPHCLSSSSSTAGIPSWLEALSVDQIGLGLAAVLVLLKGRGCGRALPLLSPGHAASGPWLSL